MFSLTDKKITIEQLKPGDHILVRRHGILYSHHGIYIAENQVIDFSEGDIFDKEIKQISLQNFIKGGTLRIRRYGVYSDPIETIKRAKKALNEKWKYSVFQNNCEHFATWCVTGNKESFQSQRTYFGLGALAAGIATLGKMMYDNYKKSKV
ncbi:MAG: lecithin retinol acyltransferase family protein [Leptospiraceae bacterium]|nr:lecithin retinol acyltransferase family protein [Leptospiraceae bacterium]MCP5494074.1 lecithin retinol acyltransferase family protein [Leptospiraceae bacterium]